MTLDSLRSKTVAILGYGNQGHAHALCLRDQGVPVLVGARAEGSGAAAAQADGFAPMPFSDAVRAADLVMFLLPDSLIGPAYRDLMPLLKEGTKWVGFAHGFAYHFGEIPPLPGCQYFLVAPKGAGTMLRARFLSGEGLPVTFAVAPDATMETRELARAYAEAIGKGSSFIRETTFQLETEGDLFGEQVVLVGGLMELIRNAYDTLVRNGHPKELAFFDVCQEVQVTVDLLLRYGPAEMLKRISSTALYGAATRGPRIINDKSRQQMQEVFQEIRQGTFAKELAEELRSGGETLKRVKSEAEHADWQKTYESLKDCLS